MKERLPLDLLRNSQLDVADFIYDNLFCACFSDMGFGKTAPVATVVEKLFRRNEINKVLIVSTILVTREVWPKELDDWEHTSYLTFKLIEGEAPERLASARGGEQIHLINQENFVWLCEQAGKTWPYDMIIFDDATGFKNEQRRNSPGRGICTHRKDCCIFEHEKTWHCKHAGNCASYVKGTYSDDCIVPCQLFEPVRSNLQACTIMCNDFKAPPARYSRFGAICQLRPQVKRLVHLTGTPTNKAYLDLWPLIFTLDSGERLGRTYTQFKQRYFTKSHNGFSWNIKPGGAVKIENLIKDICISVESEAQLPPLYPVEVEIKLPGPAAAMYDQFERDLLICLEGGDELIAANQGVLQGKLLQVCGGGVYINEKKEWLNIHDEKFKAIDQIIARHTGEPILIGYGFGHELERLKARYPQGIDIRDRRDAVHAWNSGEIPILFVHPLSAGHGLNLQLGPGRVLIWLGLAWALDQNKQLNKRLHRPGQKRDTYIYYLIARGRADSRVMEGVAKMNWSQNQLLKAVKRDATRR